MEKQDYKEINKVLYERIRQLTNTNNRLYKELKELKRKKGAQD